MTKTVWCDGSHNDQTIASACYCQETGEAIVKRFSLSDIPKCRYADWAEMRAVEMALEEFSPTIIVTDCKTLVDLASLSDWGSSPRARLFISVLEKLKLADCEVQWLPRNYNSVADWLSRCPQNARFQLEPGLTSLPKQKHPPNDKEVDLSGGRAAIYNHLVNDGSIDNIRDADEWVLDWLRRDSVSWRSGNEEVKRLRAEVKELGRKLRATEAYRRKVDRCNSLYWKEIQRLRSESRTLSADKLLSSKMVEG